MIRSISTDKAPAAVGPYSQGVHNGKMFFVSGQLPMKDGALATDIKEATKNCIENAKAILEAGNLGLDKVMKITVFLTDMGDFDAMNEVYGQYFADHKPARSAVQVVALPKGAKIEIEMIAAVEESFDL